MDWLLNQVKHCITQINRCMIMVATAALEVVTKRKVGVIPASSLVSSTINIVRVNDSPASQGIFLLLPLVSIL